MVGNMRNEDDQRRGQGVRPQLYILAGSAFTSGFPTALESLTKGSKIVVPHRVIGIDTLSYEEEAEDAFNRWSIPHKVFQASLPQDHYLYLAHIFGEMDFDSPVNQKHTNLLPDNRIRQPLKAGGSGAAGLPAVGLQRLLSKFDEVQGFIQKHKHEVTEISLRDGSDGLFLQPGVDIYIMTTLNGGTGSGVLQALGAAARQVMNVDDNLYAVAVLPTAIASADDHMKANAAAIIREIQHGHSESKSYDLGHWGQHSTVFDDIRFLDGKLEDGTFFKVHHAVAQAASVAALKLSPMQATINTRSVDLTDAHAYDFKGNGAQGARESACTVRVSPMGLEDYQIYFIIRRKLQKMQEAIVEYREKGLLSAEDERKAQQLAEKMAEELSIEKVKQAMLRDVATPPSKLIIDRMGEAQGRVGQLDASQLQASVPKVIKSLGAQVNQFIPRWEKNSSDFYKEVAEKWREIALDAIEQPAAVLAALDRLGKHVDDFFADLDRRHSEATANRQRANDVIRRELNDLDNVSGLTKNSRARDCARRVLATAQKGLTTKAQLDLYDVLIANKQLLENGRRQDIKDIVKLCNERFADVKRADIHREVEAGYLRSRALLILEDTPFNITLNAATPGEAEKAVLGQNIEFSLASVIRGEESLADLFERLREQLTGGNPRNIDQLLIEDKRSLNRVLSLARMALPSPVRADVLNNQLPSNPRNKLIIVALPGGRNSPMAKVLRERNIINDIARDVVDSGNGQMIAIYSLHKGLPYAAFDFASVLERSYERYTKSGQSLSPHSLRGNFPEVKPYETSLINEVEEMLDIGSITLPEHIMVEAAGGRTGYRFKVKRKRQDNGLEYIKELSFLNRDEARKHLITNINDFRHLSKELETAIRDNFDTVRQRLLDAIGSLPVSDPQRDGLIDYCRRLGFDPNNPDPEIPIVTTVVTNGNGSGIASNGTNGARMNGNGQLHKAETVMTAPEEPAAPQPGAELVNDQEEVNPVQPQPEEPASTDDEDDSDVWI